MKASATLTSDRLARLNSDSGTGTAATELYSSMSQKGQSRSPTQRVVEGRDVTPEPYSALSLNKSHSSGGGGAQPYSSLTLAKSQSTQREGVQPYSSLALAKGESPSSGGVEPYSSLALTKDQSTQRDDPGSKRAQTSVV